MQKFFISFFLVFYCFSFLAQSSLAPALPLQNDNQCDIGANHYLGVLPLPKACPNGGYSDSIVVNDDLSLYSAESGRPSLLQCTTSGTIPDMNPAARDCWYKFEASARNVQIRVSPMSSGNFIQSPIVGLYHFKGSCVNVIPIECSVGLNGLLELNYGNVIPGEHYYIQVTSASYSDAAPFKLSVKNKSNCFDCANVSELRVDPKPINGYYGVSDTVRFKLEINGYRSIGADLKAVVPVMASAWDPSFFIGVPSLPVSSSGMWQLAGPITVNSIVYPYAFVFNNSSAPNDGDYASANDSWVFEWLLRTNSNGSAGINLNMKVLLLSDKEILNQTTLCFNDQDVYFRSTLNACTGPTVNTYVSNTSTCNNLCSGSIINSVGTGNSTIYDVFLFDQNSGLPIFADSLSLFTHPTSSITNLCQGQYTLVLDSRDSTVCSYTNTIQIIPPILYKLQLREQDCIGSCNSSAELVVPSSQPYFTLISHHWINPPLPFLMDSLKIRNCCENQWYKLKIEMLSLGCSIFDSIFIPGIKKDDAAIIYPNPICNKSINTPYILNPGGYFSVTPVNPPTNQMFSTFTDGTIDCSYYLGTNPNYGINGIYDLIYVTDGKCPDTSFNSLSFVPYRSEDLSYPKSNYCTDELPVYPIHPNTNGSYYYQPLATPVSNYFLSLNSVTGEINPSSSDTGSYMVFHQTYLFGETPGLCDTIYSFLLRIVPDCTQGINDSDLIYSGFSPNGDGLNDSWYIPGIDSTSNQVIIYNRWGQAIWNTSNYSNISNNFRGKDVRGNIIPSGTYFFVIRKNDSIYKKGWLELTSY